MFWRKKQPSEMALALVQLLKDDPGGWSFNQFSAVHMGAKVGVWISNKSYGLTVSYNILGSRFLSGSQIKPSATDRQALYAAFGPLRAPEATPVLDAIQGWRSSRARAAD